MFGYEEMIKPEGIGISRNEKQEKLRGTKEQTNVQISGFISLLDILLPLLNNGIYDSVVAYYQEECKTESLGLNIETPPSCITGKILNFCIRTSV
ncbi:hypothetical protein RIR_jg23466.t1 [Rhizophagus irregularis DAOM 181602=DAOM 197198]|nr:hypothetical protein RIR_jg23466.t1 [Rhizophagus irregularis DAOM 181602=DAOM 197198]CAB4489652.1 unnamed protein product [Rhizophagus irregularis]